MSCKAKLTLEEREEFKEYQEIHKMSQGISFWEFVSGVMAQAFLGIRESGIMPPPTSLLPPKLTRWVSTDLVALGLSVELYSLWRQGQ